MRSPELTDTRLLFRGCPRLLRGRLVLDAVDEREWPVPLEDRPRSPGILDSPTTN